MHFRTMTSLFAAFAAVTLACSGGDGTSTPNPSPDGGGGGGGGGGGNFECCLNSAHYTCPSDKDAKKCAGIGDFDLPGCLQACAGGDFTCSDACFQKQQAANGKPDPSACTATPGTCNSGGGGGGGGGICSKASAGADCTADYQCGSGKHCTDKRCYPNSTNNPCSADYQCGSGNHCTNSCCFDASKGNPCSADYQCSSSNCTNSKCQ